MNIIKEKVMAYYQKSKGNNMWSTAYGAKENINIHDTVVKKIKEILAPCFIIIPIFLVFLFLERGNDVITLELILFPLAIGFVLLLARPIIGLISIVTGNFVIINDVITEHEEVYSEDSTYDYAYGLYSGKISISETDYGLCLPGTRMYIMKVKTRWDKKYPTAIKVRKPRHLSRFNIIDVYPATKYAIPPEMLDKVTIVVENTYRPMENIYTDEDLFRNSARTENYLNNSTNFDSKFVYDDRDQHSTL